MATLLHHTPQFNPNFKPVFSALTAAVARVSAAVLNWFIALGDAHSRSEEFEYLNALSDTQLHTRYGIERRDIAAYIFRDKIA